jgi:hypothetical protein
LQQALLLQTLSVLFRIRFVFSSAAARLKTFFCKSLQRVFARPKTHTNSTHQFQHPIVMQKMNAAKHKERFENQNSNDLSNSFTKP